MLSTLFFKPTKPQFSTKGDKENDRDALLREQEDKMLMRAIAMSLEGEEVMKEGLLFITQSEPGESALNKKIPPFVL